MTPRERYLASLLFGRPDRVTLSPGHPRESTLAAWRQQGLPEGADYDETMLGLLGLAPEPRRKMVIMAHSGQGKTNQSMTDHSGTMTAKMAATSWMREMITDAA